jgi:hypothetical protein
MNCALKMLNFALIVRHVSSDLAVYHWVQPETIPFWVGADGGTPAHVVEALVATEVELLLLIPMLELEVDVVVVLDEDTTGFDRYFMLLKLPELSVQL